MAIKLPLLKAQDPVFDRYQTLLQGALAPITSNESNAAVQVMITAANGTKSPDISLTAGSVNTIPIGLSQALQGWYITRIKGNAVVWDSQDSNTTPSQTLLLNTSADVVIQLQVY